MEYNVQYKILFEKSMLNQLITACRNEWEDFELVDEVYANVRTYNSDDKVHFVYRGYRDYARLAKFIKKKNRALNIG